MFEDLIKKFKGELVFDEVVRLSYATDASAYRELPLAVAYPVDEKGNRPPGEGGRNWSCQKKTHRYPFESTTNQGGQRCV